MTRPAVDLSVLDKLRRDLAADTAFLRELVEIFLAEAPKLLARVQAGVRAGDAAQVRLAAHTLKSTSAQLGAIHLSALAKEIEAHAAADEIDGVAAKTGPLADELHRVHAELEAFAAGLT